MHRVELKAASGIKVKDAEIVVPNAPCGVERQSQTLATIATGLVPNAPCGVERPSYSSRKLHSSTFLMHRVELKDEDRIFRPEWIKYCS